MDGLHLKAPKSRRSFVSFIKTPITIYRFINLKLIVHVLICSAFSTLLGFFKNYFHQKFEFFNIINYILFSHYTLVLKHFFFRTFSTLFFRLLFLCLFSSSVLTTTLFLLTSYTSILRKLFSIKFLLEFLCCFNLAKIIFYSHSLLKLFSKKTLNSLKFLRLFPFQFPSSVNWFCYTALFLSLFHSSFCLDLDSTFQPIIYPLNAFHNSTINIDKTSKSPSLLTNHQKDLMTTLPESNFKKNGEMKKAFLDKFNKLIRDKTRDFIMAPSKQSLLTTSIIPCTKDKSSTRGLWAKYKRYYDRNDLKFNENSKKFHLKEKFFLKILLKKNFKILKYIKLEIFKKSCRTLSEKAYRNTIKNCLPFNRINSNFFKKPEKEVFRLKNSPSLLAFTEPILSSVQENNSRLKPFLVRKKKMNNLRVIKKQKLIRQVKSTPSVEKPFKKAVFFIKNSSNTSRHTNAAFQTCCEQATLINISPTNNNTFNYSVVFIKTFIRFSEFFSFITSSFYNKFPHLRNRRSIEDNFTLIKDKNEDIEKVEINTRSNILVQRVKNFNVYLQQPHRFDFQVGRTKMTDFEVIVYRIVTPIVYSLLTITGTIGNLLVIFVIISKKQMRTATNYLLLNLAFSDILFIRYILHSN